MSWLVLALSGVLEAVWATALGKSEGFSRLTPSLVFALALTGSMAGLAYAMRDLPVGTSYAVWVGIGAVLTVLYAMLTGDESVSALKVLFLALIVGSVISHPHTNLAPRPRAPTHQGVKRQARAGSCPARAARPRAYGPGTCRGVRSGYGFFSIS
ncbi:DMT family transporter [Streptomyces sp. NPDC091287]|uniref:DMT family transporter n=1 Tax=Streptomyces sp. NPDC091287 TaxID=3365988 RepID=UPI003817095E